MKTSKHEIEDILLVHLAVAAFVCVALLTSALSSALSSGPAVDLGRPGRDFDAARYPYIR